MSVRGQRVDVVVVGGGPAGAIVARGLALLGHEVAVVSAPRPFAAVEGVSERAAAVLRRIGARHALAALGGPIPRTSTWGGRSSRANVEHLVDRDAFDRRLRQDACDAGARGVEGRVVRCLREGNGWRVTVATSERKSATLQARFLVEARGRSAPVDPTARRGPLGVALVAEWRLAKRKRRQTAIASFRHGWAWLVVAGHGRAYLQVVVSGAARRLPSRGALGRFYVALVRQIPEAARWLEGAEMAGNVRARASTAALSGEIAADDFVRVGDAAFAVDPLSGSGIYEAIAGALGAVPVVNTLIHRPAQGLIARRFHRERVEDAFLRMARVGRDFHRMEERFAAEPYWAERSGWPDDEPLEPVRPEEALTIERRAVAEAGLVVEQDVLVTGAFPRGVWRVAGVPVVPLLAHAAKRRKPTADVARAFARSHGLDPAAVATALRWIEENASPFLRRG